METFIRLDQVGHWRGTEHISRFQGLSDEEMVWMQEDGGTAYLEKGISCYEFTGEGIADLYNYWRVVVGLEEVNLIENMQVTIFKGEFVGWGTDNECLATCTETVKEFPAKVLFDKWMEMKQRWFDDEETSATDEKEYMIEHAQEMIDFINAQ